ncbi:MAG: alpha/beta hydrolase [Anaerolineae bacterium]|nr:alpha/beta hydrolase [Anaerolineae bacterium]
MKTRSLAKFLSGVSLILGALHFVHLRTSMGLGPWFFKIVAQALSPWLAVVGAAGALLGGLSRAPLALVAGLAGAWASVGYVRRTLASTADFERAFGPGWQGRIPEARRRRMLQKRWTPFLARDPEARWAQNVVFAHVAPSPMQGAETAPLQGVTDPGRRPPGRPLLCDVWQPPAGVAPSGLAVVFLHGGAWYLGDKDMATRPLFRHLAAQGHVIVDVAYRLYPEATILEMVHDAKRAVAWIKAHAADYQVDPERVVLAGGSAGAHLALLAAYTPDHPALTPHELAGADLSACAVVSFYGPTDLEAVAGYNQTLMHEWGENPLPAAAAPAFGEPSWWTAQWEAMRRGVPLAHELAGCAPDELPAMYELGSPLHHVAAGCPPTLLLHGTHDFIVPVESARALYHKLLAAGVAAVYLELPQTDHAFDFALPRLSPPAQGAWYELDRFLALFGRQTTGDE